MNRSSYFLLVNLTFVILQGCSGSRMAGNLNNSSQGLVTPSGISSSANVSPSVSAPIPANAKVASNLEQSSSWIENNDGGISGSSSGITNLVSSPSVTGQSRELSMSYSNSGGEIWHLSFGSDTQATHFVYDNYIYIEQTSSLGNLEMDMNQVIANGDTVIYGVQCDGYSGTWDYTINTGTPTNPYDTWMHSNIPCNPRNWAPNVWHHVQIAYSRTSTGVVTYESVWFDGKQSDFNNATGNSAFALGWGASLVTNFQIDGLGSSGSVKAYFDKLTVSRW